MVGILVDEKIRGQVLEVKWVNNRVMLIKFVIEGSMLNVVSSYTPQVGLDKRHFEH